MPRKERERQKRYEVKEWVKEKCTGDGHRGQYKEKICQGASQEVGETIQVLYSTLLFTHCLFRFYFFKTWTNHLRSVLGICSKKVSSLIPKCQKIPAPDLLKYFLICSKSKTYKIIIFLFIQCENEEECRDIKKTHLERESSSRLAASAHSITTANHCNMNENR